MVVGSIPTSDTNVNYGPHNIRVALTRFGYQVIE
jgi:hypothetical protein